MAVPRVVPDLRSDSRAEEAAQRHVGDGSVHGVARRPEGALGPAGTVTTVDLEVAGHQFVGIDGGPGSPFTESVSSPVTCADQVEVDRCRDRLVRDGGEEGQCGWLEDRYGSAGRSSPRAAADGVPVG